MTITLSAAVIVLGVLVLLLLGAQVEMYRTVEQLREAGGLVDRPRPLDLPRGGRPPGEAGLPPALDGAVRGPCAGGRCAGSARAGRPPRTWCSGTATPGEP